MSVQISDGGKRVYAPGESGTIRANFDMGNFSGTVDKDVSVWLAGDPEASPSQHLTVRVHIPILIELEPKTVKWATNGELKPQTFQIKMNGEKPIHISNVGASGQDFTHELKTIEDGKRYELIVTPKSLQKPALGIFRIQTDCEIQKHSMQQAFAVVAK